jgi:hypothetical protein
MRRQCERVGRRNAAPKYICFRMPKGSKTWKAASLEAIGRAERGPAGWSTAARPKRMAR